MIYILHGDNLPRSRSVVLKLQEKYNAVNKKEISINDVSPNELKEEVSSFSIFDEPPFVVLDVSGAGRLNQKDYVDVVKNASSDAHVVVLSSKKLKKSSLWIKNANNLNAKVIESSEVDDSNVFKFVDYVFEGKRKESYIELRKLFLSGKDQFYIFSMLLYGLRNLIASKHSAPHFKKTSPYVVSKTARQAKKYTPQQIDEIVEYFYNLDIKVKTGEIAPDVLVTLAMERVLSF